MGGGVSAASGGVVVGQGAEILFLWVANLSEIFTQNPREPRVFVKSPNDRFEEYHFLFYGPAAFWGLSNV